MYIFKVIFIIKKPKKFNLKNENISPLQHGDGASTCRYTVKKMLTVIPTPAGMSLTKLSLAGNNKIFLGQ
jgi:hypothetical protein